MSINHPFTNTSLACAEPSLDYFQHLKLHAHVSVVFVLSPSPQCQNIGLGGEGVCIVYTDTHSTHSYINISCCENYQASQLQRVARIFLGGGFKYLFPPLFEDDCLLAQYCRYRLKPSKISFG